MGLKKLWVFFGLAYAISWSIFAIFYYGAGMKEGASYTSMIFIYMFGPLIAAVICGTMFRGASFVGMMIKLRFNRYLLLSLFLPLVFLFVTLLVSKILGVEVLSYHEAIQDPENPVDTWVYYFFFVFVYLFVLLFNGLFSISEELGFRGFALSEALPKMGFWKSSVLIGLLWGLWHAPLILTGYNYPSAPIGGIFMVMMICVSITPLMNFITLKSKTIWAPCLFHGGFNHLAGISVFMCGIEGFPYMGMMGIAGVLSGIAMCIYIQLFHRKFLSRINSEISVTTTSTDSQSV